MSRRSVRGVVLVVVVALVAVLGVAACGGDDDDVASAAQATCDALGEFWQAGLAIQGLDPSTASLDDFQRERDRARDRLQDVQSAADETREAAASELEAAFDELEAAVDDNSDLPLTELLPAVQPEIENIIATWNQINQDLQCAETTEE